MSKLFTFTHYDVEHPLTWMPDVMATMEYQEEIAPTTGRHHHQGWMYFINKIRIETVRNKFPGVHIEKAKGTWKQNHEYCTKADTRAPGTEPVLHGAYPASAGAHGRWETIKGNLQDGKTIGDIIDEEPGLCMYDRALNVLQNVVHRETQRDEVQVFWVWGAPGVGKSHGVRQLTKNPYVTRVELDGRIWFNGYETQQQDLIIEEMVSTDDSPLLRMVLDKYPMLAPVKLGQPVKAGWTRVFITSNAPPPLAGAIGDRIDTVFQVIGESRRKRRRTIVTGDLQSAYEDHFEPPQLSEVPFLRAPTTTPIQHPETIIIESDDEEVQAQDSQVVEATRSSAQILEARYGERWPEEAPLFYAP